MTLLSDVNSSGVNLGNGQAEPNARESETLGAEADPVDSITSHAKVNEECTTRNNNLETHTPAHVGTDMISSPKTELTHGSANRQPNDPKQREKIVDKLRRSVYIKGLERQLYNYFQRQPSKLQKEIDQAAGGEVERIQLAGVDLRVITYTAKQKESLLQLTSLDGRTVSTSLPHALTRWQEHQAHNVKNGPRGVIHGLRESGENLAKIAASHGLKSLKQIGKPETSHTILVTFDQRASLPTHMYIQGRRFKVWQYIPRPKRCDNCQAFTHTTEKCKTQAVCSRCSGPHPYLECPDKQVVQCANCKLPHSAAFKKCSKYLEEQDIIKNKMMLYADKVKQGIQAHKHTQETQYPNPAPAALPMYEEDEYKEFVNIDETKYKVTDNVEYAEDHPKATDLKIKTFIRGCVALLDGDKPAPEMQRIISKVGSLMFYDGRIKFRFNTETHTQ